VPIGWASVPNDTCGGAYVRFGGVKRRVVLIGETSVWWLNWAFAAGIAGVGLIVVGNPAAKVFGAVLLVVVAPLFLYFARRQKASGR
jgi:hypothetical protein